MPDKCVVAHSASCSLPLLTAAARTPLQIGVAYIGQDGQRVRHYLVTPNDIAGAKRSLCDFLAEQDQFSTLLRYGVDPQNGAPVFTPTAKDGALRPFVRARKRDADEVDVPEGYQPLA